MMKLYRGKISPIAQEMSQVLVREKAIEVTDQGLPEVRLDIEAVLKEYLRTEREINDEARELLERRGEGFSHFGKTKRKVARRRKFGLGEEALDWITKQLIEMLLHTVHVEEVWAEDNVLRKHMREILKKHMKDADSEIDLEVRKRIKNLNEGTSDWDERYQQIKEQIKSSRGLE